MDQRPRGKVVVAAAPGGGGVDERTLRMVRGGWGAGLDIRFFVIVLVSLSVHGLLLYILINIKLAEPQPVQITRVPERFAKLIVEKPIPKETKTPPETVAEDGTGQPPVEEKAARQEVSDAPPTAVERKAAKTAVARRAARVEEKIRTVGVLGMLTGTGTTAKGKGVVDVLGSVRKGRETSQDLEKALNNMSGLQKAGSEALVERKLVKSKDVSISHTEAIDHLIAGLGSAKTSTLSKKGTFLVQKPESIEGAASSHAKRDYKIINRVVVRNKVSLRMSYEKYLKRDPTLSGKITVRFTILASGRVSDVQILENTLGSTGLENEISRKVRMWRFEAIPEGDVTVTYPFVFQPS